MHAEPKAASVWRSESNGNGGSDAAHGFGQSSLPVTGRITRAEDFERVLKSKQQTRSPHFAVHHLVSVPSRPKKADLNAKKKQLSTSAASRPSVAVDDLPEIGPAQSVPGRTWLGMVVPKRHAKRAVTRNLLKRQIKAVMSEQSAVPPGLWVVRLRAPFDRNIFTSAASKTLSNAVREELMRVLQSAVQRHPAA